MHQLPEWISPQEASLVMSIMRGVYISSDDIKQLRNDGRLPDDSYIRVSKRNTIYKRSAIEAFSGLNKRAPKEVDANIMAVWLWEFEETVNVLESQGYAIPSRKAAEQMVPIIRAKQANPKIGTKTP